VWIEENKMKEILELIDITHLPFVYLVRTSSGDRWWKRTYEDRKAPLPPPRLGGRNELRCQADRCMVINLPTDEFKKF
jgi:hypothetical protein